MKHKIEIWNPVTASCNAELFQLVKSELSFKAVMYRQGMYKKERTEYVKYLMKKGKNGHYFFWAGLVHVVQKYCDDKSIPYEIEDHSQEKFTMYEPMLPNVTFREDQMRLMDSFLDSPRGILVSFTGSGKTVLGFGIISAFENIRVLWLCHKKDLMHQAYDEAIKFGFKSVGRIGDGYAESNKLITIATRQSFIDLCEDMGCEYDMVVVDEAHHVGGNSIGEYTKILNSVMAPIRLGLTATLPREGEPYLTCVGLLGPIIGELTINEGNEAGTLAKPKIKILKTTKDYAIMEMKHYPQVYNAGIVNRIERNLLIAQTTKNHTDSGDTVLIMINHIEHGENILRQLTALGVAAEFVKGSTDGDDRTKIKHAFNDGTIKCVICSSVWTEGVNIPNLNVVICAAGGKSEIRTLQSVGRGLRKTKDKDEVYIYDIFDNSHRYLIEHFAERLMVYIDNGWL